MVDDIQLKGLSVERTYEIIPKRTILLGYVGSIAHGTYVPKSNPDSIDDIDIMGVSVGPPEAYMGLQKFEQKIRMVDEWDSVVYEARKFVSLLLKSNPNVLGMLWLSDNNYIRIHELGKRLIDNRDLFVSKMAYHAFTGYAHAQLQKMTRGAFQGYMGTKRRELVERFGYDTKNAAHLIRLLRMGIEFLTEGRLLVFREDAKELKAIKSGEWSLEKVQEEADRLFVLSQEAYIRSPIPPKPNTGKAEQVLISIVRDALEVKL